MSNDPVIEIPAHLASRGMVDVKITPCNCGGHKLHIFIDPKVIDPNSRNNYEAEQALAVPLVKALNAVGEWACDIEFTAAHSAPVDLDLTDEMMDLDWKNYEEKFVRGDSRYLRFSQGVEIEMALCREQHAHHATLRRLHITSLLLAATSFLLIAQSLGVFK